VGDSQAAERTPEAYGDALIAAAVKHMFEESVPRILQCLTMLSEEEVWFRPNEETVSIGNLIVHLCGNVRQWIICGLGGAVDERKRSLEFEEKGPMSNAVLEERLRSTMSEARATLERVDPESLLGARRVQGNDETGMSIIMHVVEHFSYHTGQITFAVKSRKNLDMGYYAGQDLNATS
jgi:uncharacterized damage-inducible protein DinB